MKLKPVNELAQHLIVDPVSVITESSIITPDGTSMDALLTCIVLVVPDSCKGYEVGDVLLYQPAYLTSRSHSRLNNGKVISFLKKEGVIGVCTLGENEKLEPVLKVDWTKGEEYRTDKSSLEWITGRE